MIEDAKTRPRGVPAQRRPRGRHAAPAGRADRRARGRRRKRPAPGGPARASILMAAGTVVSRATGLVRTVLQAAALGTGLLASTYNTANTVPTSLYTLLIGGAQLLLAAGLGAALGWAAAHACAAELGTGTGPTALSLTAGTVTLAAVYVTTARLLRVAELRRLPGRR